MLQSILGKVVGVCTRFPWAVVAISLVLAIVSGVYTARNFAINTNIMELIAKDLPFRQRELAFDAAFPQRAYSTLVVIEAKTPEKAAQAAEALAAELARRGDMFRAVTQPGGSEFFRRNGLLFQPVEEVNKTTRQFAEAAPLISVLASDRSLRGLTQGLSFGLMGVQAGYSTMDNLGFAFTMAADAIESVNSGSPASFSWRNLVNGRPAEPSELRRFIDVQPVLDFAALEPGRAASNVIRETAAALRLGSLYGATVRITGFIPIEDDEFATVKEGALVNGILTVLTVLGILWLALRSFQLITAVFISLFIGLFITSALGLMLVGSLNLISIAFAVLFVGLGVDFGIQYSVRYRAERHEFDDVPEALRKAAGSVGAPLTLAAAATAAGFLSFLPTDYRGIAELGQIAGLGMFIAYVTSLTVLPALLVLFRPPGEEHPIGYKALAPVDRFLQRNRVGILAMTAIVSLGGAPLLNNLRFDFNPINLRSASVESVATYLELRKDPTLGASSIQLLTRSPQEAAAVSERLGRLSEASRVISINEFVPQNQPQKLDAIRRLEQAVGPALSRQTRRPAPSDRENVAALRQTADALARASATAAAEGEGGMAAQRLSQAMIALADGPESARQRATDVFITPLNVVLQDMRDLLLARPITLENLPADLKRDWIAPDGRVRVEIQPTGDPNDNENLRRFARAVLEVAPEATGGPISILESGRTIVRAFMEAGAWALLSISILLWLTLRRLSDVLLTLVPLLLAGLITLEVCVLIGLELNFANIIALPLLLGIGVAFKIYYVMAWRAGQTNLLQSSLTKAVFFSALTTATAFGSLWMSSHPGTSSMGKLLALSLLCTMVTAILFQPVLMGKPRKLRRLAALRARREPEPEPSAN